MVIAAVQTAGRLTPDFEVIVINDGSRDATPRSSTNWRASTRRCASIHHQQQPRVRRRAAQRASRAPRRSWIFYTDGDAQYDPGRWRCSGRSGTPAVDLVNGYKISRSDPLHRIVIGRVYHHTVKLLFGLKVRDVDCDFRLMRRAIFDRVTLTKNSGVICLEMMKKIQDAGFPSPRSPVHHYHRAYGKSQFFNFRRIGRTAVDVLKLWWRARRRGATGAGATAPPARVAGHER